MHCYCKLKVNRMVHVWDFPFDVAALQSEPSENVKTAGAQTTKVVLFSYLSA